MGLVDWWRNRNNGASPALEGWRRDWQLASAAAHPDEAVVKDLARRLDALGLPEEDVEIEREMLDALEQLAVLSRTVDASGLPVIETGHRVVGRDLCHFSTPVSMPDEPAQPAGRLLLTHARAVFAGGAQASTISWHAVARVVRTARDLVLVRRETEAAHRFRCNSYGDALCASYLAQRLARNAGVLPGEERTL